MYANKQRHKAWQKSPAMLQQLDSTNLHNKQNHNQNYNHTPTKLPGQMMNEAQGQENRTEPSQAVHGIRLWRFLRIEWNKMATFSFVKRRWTLNDFSIIL